MRFLKLITCLSIVLSFIGSVYAAEPTAPDLLPTTFGGWQIAVSAVSSKDPGAADPTNATVLKEYGFKEFQSATYTRDDGRKLSVKAARFEDATGAYGAFTYYKLPPMLVEKIGDQGASLNERVLFYRGNVLVDAVFSKLSAMSAAELRDLASSFAPPAANASKLPGLPAYLPRQSYVKNSAKYVLGPAAFDKIDPLVPAQLVDFSAAPEVVQGKYAASGGEATLMLIYYPTPQIAAEHLRRIDAAHQASSDQPAVASQSPFFDKRTGPIVVIGSGPLSPSEGKSLLASVNYDADVTWNENTSFDKRDNLANLLFNVIILCGIILGLMLVAGVAFGGVRLLVKRFFPDRVFDRPEEMEFISLHLSDKRSEPSIRG